jgi:hypothetical protein
MLNLGLCVEKFCSLLKVISEFRKLFTAQKPDNKNGGNSSVNIHGNNNTVNITNIFLIEDTARIKDKAIKNSFKIADPSTPLWLHCRTNDGGHFALGEYFLCETPRGIIYLWLGIQSNKETKTTNLTLHFWNNEWNSLPESCGLKKDTMTNSSYIVIDDILNVSPDKAALICKDRLIEVLNKIKE